MFPSLERRIIALDFETTGLQYWDPSFSIFGVAIAFVDDFKFHSMYFDAREYPRVFEWLRNELPKTHLVVAQFAQFEAQCVHSIGIDPQDIEWYCTMTAACLIDEHMIKYDLQSIAAYNHVHTRKGELQDRIRLALGAKSIDAAMANLQHAPADLVSEYGAEDAATALKIYFAQYPELENQELLKVMNLEMRLMPVLARMSRVGVRVDTEAAEASIPELTARADVLQRELNDITGTNFNANSTPQIRALFDPQPISPYQFVCNDGTIIGLTKSGKGPSLDQNALRSMKHPAAAKIIQLRKTVKLRDTFVRGHILGNADQNGYVHTTFNQTRNDEDAGTGTGRLSSTDPALQQITKRDKDNAALLRSFFLPDRGQAWLCIDHSQIDFRCSAHLVNDPRIIEQYKENPNLDFHQIVADMTGIPRNAPYAGAPYAKQMNLSMAFGAGPGKACFMMGMPYKIEEYKGKMMYIAGPEGRAVFELYHQKLPGVRAFMKQAERVAHSTGYVRTQIGRRLRLGKGTAHKAAGLLYQSYAADIHKYALIAVDQALKGTEGRLMLSVHDEADLSAPNDDKLKARCVEAYTDFQSDHSPVKMRVPITASAKFGVNWWEASKD